MDSPNETRNNGLGNHEFLEVNNVLLQCDSLIWGDLNLVNWILHYDEYRDVTGSIECKRFDM